MSAAPLTVAPLAVTMGDPAGIGPDITVMAYAHRQALALPAFVLFADPDVLKRRAEALGLTCPIHVIEHPDAAAKTFATALPVMPIVSKHTVTPGQADVSHAQAVIASIDAAVAATRDGATSAIVTNPIAKSIVQAAGFKHPGHTEYLGALAAMHWPGDAAHPIMMLACDALRVVPMTIHVPLRDIPALITEKRISETVRITAAALKRDFAIPAPRMAICGLNPHAGEDGSIGLEDRDVIAPAIAALKAEGFDVMGPLAADTLFHDEARQHYDVAIAMYHDQALIPIKTLAFDLGVNVTLGLPFVRTSPDHGTAFAIAGTGAARPTSFCQALLLAERCARRRLALHHAGSTS